MTAREELRGESNNKWDLQLPPHQMEPSGRGFLEFREKGFSMRGLPTGAQGKKLALFLKGERAGKDGIEHTVGLSKRTGLVWKKTVVKGFVKMRLFSGAGEGIEKKEGIRGTLQ